jgi:hypothetical protein
MCVVKVDYFRLLLSEEMTAPTVKYNDPSKCDSLLD